MKCYLDTSALLKPAFGEDEADDYKTTLQMLKASGWTMVTSVLSQVEVRRAIRREVASGRIPGESADEKIALLFDGIDIIDIDQQVIDEACVIDGEGLRSLDAIHLATARLIGADMVIAYDERLLRACMDRGVMTAQPGALRPYLPDGWEFIPDTEDIDWDAIDRLEEQTLGLP